MPANLTDNYVANTYKGVLHANGEELPDGSKIQVYDGAGNATAIKLGVNSVGIDCNSLSAYGLTANDFKYPETPGNAYDVMCQVTNNTTGVNSLQLEPIQEIFCKSNTGSSYARTSDNIIPIPNIECGIVKRVDEQAVSEITAADGGINLNETGEFSIVRAVVKGGIITALSLNEIVKPSYPNLLINAQGMLNQRRMSPNASLTADWNPRKYFIDRWKLLAGDSLNWTFNSNRNIATIFAPAGGVSQIIEKADIVPGTHVLSWIGDATANILEAGVSKSTGTGGTGTIKSLTVNLGGGGDVEVRFTNGAFSLPKLERSKIRTDFVYEDINTVVSKCQRYFVKTYNYIDRPGTQGGTGAVLSHSNEPVGEPGFIHNLGWDFPVRTRYWTWEGNTPSATPAAWVFSSTGRIGFVNLGEARSGREFYYDFPIRFPLLSEGRISGIYTNKGLPPGVMRTYSCHYVVDAEL